MNNISEDVILKNDNDTYGNGKDIIEILNVGFEPFLTKEEFALHKQIMKHKLKVRILENRNKIIDDIILKSYLYDVSDEYDRNDFTYIMWMEQFRWSNTRTIYRLNNRIKILKQRFNDKLDSNVGLLRNLFDKRDFTNKDQCRNIAIFESSLTRMLKCENFKFTDSLMCIVTYYTQILNGLINNGYMYNHKRYVFFTAGAGATRQKKSTFIRKDLLMKYRNKMFCGLTESKINELGGMNTNKYLAYTSLIQSNTSIWKEFNIMKAIVVNDIEFKIPNKKVRHIYTSTPDDIEMVEKLELEYQKLDLKQKENKVRKEEIPKENRKERKVFIDEIKRLMEEKKRVKLEIKSIKDKYYKCEIKNMDVDIPFTDGFGISLKEKGSFMVRLPFVKGLLSYAPYSRFKTYCKENKLKINKITDIYGKEYDIDKDNIEYIFTESQFKMAKYFKNEYDENGNIVKTGWEKYQENFIMYECEPCRCNIEKNVKLNAKTNYQILQTLTTEMTDDDIISIASHDLDDLKGIGNNIQSMLNILNANDLNDRKSPLQESLIRYPEMLKDVYIKEYLKSTRDSVINKMRGGKFKINGAYTFIIPDVLACMQWWLLGERDLNKLGVIHDENMVYCGLFLDNEEIDCLRSPHLDHAHCIRNNMKKELCKKWFTTKGLYIGVNDIMCKFLMFDVDGDKSLVHNNKTIIANAKQYQSKYGMIPNFYDMAKAKPMMITKENLFKGIVLAYHHGNIGTPSNEITKIDNRLGLETTKREVMESINVIAFRCLDVNMTIDYSKTLWKMEVTKPIKELYRKYGSKKVPCFFKYAKGKTDSQVEKRGSGNIDRIYNLIPVNRIVFKDILPSYSYKNLMSYDVDIKTEEAMKVIDLYNLVNDNNSNKKIMSTVSELEDETKGEMLQEKLDVHNKVEMFINILGMDEEYIVNVLVKYLHDNPRKDTLWKMFGDVIYKNVCSNIPSNTKLCEVCGKRFEYEQKVGKPEIYCGKCKKEKELERKRRWKNK